MTVTPQSRILVVDDIADNCFLLKVLLEAEGYAVDMAASGKTALCKITSSPPDLVLLDIMMPDMNGYDVTRKIRQDSQTSALPILLITAFDEAIASEGFKAGANGFIRKPFEFKDLLSRVRNSLRPEIKS